MKIDAHQHFWVYDRVRDSWIDDTMKVIRKDFLPSDLAPIYKKNGIDGCVAVQADQSEKETMFLLEQANGNPFIKFSICWLTFASSEPLSLICFKSDSVNIV